MSNQPECPECQKLADISKESNKIGSFLEWLLHETQYSFGKWINDENGNSIFINTHVGDRIINELLAQYYGIDLNKVEEERIALLDWLRNR